MQVWFPLAMLLVLGNACCPGPGARLGALPLGSAPKSGSRTQSAAQWGSAKADARTNAQSVSLVLVTWPKTNSIARWRQIS
ncbi:hypothetical protein Taro_034699 [Colocasia esculenta]|uniref:Uncharacterized protein n=1 Tax=Colocasia esculenta TaxID=4460 RepID=A0A843W4P6_COLES|nr:hypothetical protein [Colocasia esculenta]